MPAMGLREIQAGGGGALGAVARLGLWPLTGAYVLATGARDLAWRWGLRRATRLPVPVISVGNLTAGGTGKTPFVALLVERLRARGRRPGVLARGYGPCVAGGLSDEGAVLAFLAGPDLPQREDPDRVRAGRDLLAAPRPPDVLVLDDGFQHRRLGRDLDVVLLDASNPCGFGHRLPRGLLREHPRALARAGLVVVTRAERAVPDELEALRAEVARFTSAPLLLARTRASALHVGGTVHAPEALAGVPVFAFAGLGNPSAFEATLTDLGAEVRGRRFVADHGGLDAAGWDALRAAARRAGARWIVVTRKDAVKRERLEDDVAVLDVATELVEGSEHLEGALDAALDHRMPGA
jgi:tetraacyldisaccharide 4'-kinase